MAHTIAHTIRHPYTTLVGGRLTMTTIQADTLMPSQ